jgi:hypothetical protein
MSAKLESSVRHALSGNLHVMEESELRFKDAIMHIAAAQLKAITIAISVGKGIENATPGVEQGERGWCMGNTFTAHDAIAALGGVSSRRPQPTI